MRIFAIPPAIIKVCFWPFVQLLNCVKYLSSWQVLGGGFVERAIMQI